MEISDRLTAFQKGQVRYFTGRRCQRGHISERYTKNGACISCLRPNDPLELVTLRIRCHPDDAKTIQDLEAILMDHRIAAQESAPAVALRPGESTEEEKDRRHAKRLLEQGLPWTPRIPTHGQG